jgi:hypothetical protein
MLGDLTRQMNAMGLIFDYNCVVDPRERIGWEATVNDWAHNLNDFAGTGHAKKVPPKQ